MNTRAKPIPLPRFWFSLALLCWGTLTGNLSGAVVMALMLEAIDLVKVKWRMENREFYRAADLSALVLAGVSILQFSRHSVHGIYEILAAAPYCFYPLMIAQRASTAQTIPLSALFYGLRRRPEFIQRVDFSPFYIGSCLLAATTTNNRGGLYLLFVATIVLGMLAVARPRRFATPVWVVSALIAIALGLAAQYGILRTQRIAEAALMYWFNQFLGQGTTDPERAITAIGSIGRLKLSDQIRIRARPDRTPTLPLLLQEASYDSFNFGTWFANNAEFDALAPAGGDKTWRNAPAGTGKRLSVQISLQHREDLVVLPLPRGTSEVRSDEIAEMQFNRFGTLMAESPRGALYYEADFDPETSLEPAPRPGDLNIPPDYKDLLQAVSEEIGLQGARPTEALARITDYFRDNFSYTLIQSAIPGRRTPLAEFLLRKRRGHCEYFATATVLLLRQAGIPARYAVGYVVDEYSPWERAYVGRARDAHSWALAHVDGRWLVMDTTPSIWHQLESEQASNWQSVGDLLAWIHYRFQRLQQADLSESADFLVWLVPPLALVLFLRLRRSSLAVKESNEKTAAVTGAHTDSLLDPLLSALATRGLRPDAGETVERFLTRAAPESSAGVSIRQLIARYYRLRFSAQVMDEDSFRDLQRLVLSFTESMETSI